MSRLAAWRVLRSGSPTPLREVDRVAAERGLDARDRALARRLVGTVLRRTGTLRALTRAFAKGKPQPEIAAHLHVGFAQLFFLDRVPVHAAVSETVRAACDTEGLSKGRYVNGTLRSALRARREGSSGDPCRDLVGRPWHFDEPLFRDPDEHPFLWAEDALSIPAPLVKRWTKRHGAERARALAEVFGEEPELSLRVVSGDRDALAAELGGRPGRHPAILRLPAEATERALAHPAFEAGALVVQGESALRAAELVGAGPGERVLDLCAAPGGKAAVLAGAGAHVVAVDVDPGRAERVAETARRLGLEERLEVRVQDGRELPAEDEGAFDAVLVDAPCSNTGVLGARPAARWRFGPATLRSLGELQAALLERAAAAVRPGGRLVWSTCSLEPEENGQRVRRFLEAHPDFALEEDHESLPEGASDAVPAGPVDGGYAARLVRA